MTDEKSFEQTEMRNLVMLLAEKNKTLAGSPEENDFNVKELNLDGAVTVLYPCTPSGDKDKRGTVDHLFAFNAHDVPALQTMEKYAQEMQRHGFGYISVDFVYPDGSFVHPMGQQGLGGEMKDFHNAVQTHSARADRTSDPGEFDADWSGKPVAKKKMPHTGG